jgi:hypothetical protein
MDQLSALPAPIGTREAGNLCMNKTQRLQFLQERSKLQRNLRPEDQKQGLTPQGGD